MKKIAVSLFLLVALFGCGNSGENDSNAEGAGKIAIFGEARYDSGYKYDK